MTQQSQEPLAFVQLPESYNYLAPDGSEIRLLPDLQAGGMAHCTLGQGVSSAVTHRTVGEIWYFISHRGQEMTKQSTSLVTGERSSNGSMSLHTPCRIVPTEDAFPVSHHGRGATLFPVRHPPTLAGRR
jgi:hypothetical protein